MGYVRFFRRMQIAPGVRLNLSKSGPSLSLGVRGAHVTVGRRGVTKTVGLPGTGLFYTSPAGHHAGVHTSHAFVPPPGATAAAHERRASPVGCVVWLVAAVVLLTIIGKL